MTSIKRSAQELPSILEDAPMFPIRHKVPRQERLSESEMNENRKAFHEFLANNVPINFIKPEIRNFFIIRANLRLDEAKLDGISIMDVSIGDNCLPVWSRYTWDPSVESLHTNIQNHLNDFELAQRIGWLKTEIIMKSNRKLDIARSLGVQLADISIGRGLLPTWSDDVVRNLSSEQSEVAHLTRKTGQLSLSTDSTSVETASDVLASITLVDSGAEFSPADFTSPDSSSSDSSNSDSASDYDDNSENVPTCPEADILPSICMNNLIGNQAYYSDNDDVGNVVHDVEVEGAPPGHRLVELEIFVANDDDEVDDLPEMELAIDGDAYDCWFDTPEAVTIDVPNVELHCTGDAIPVTDKDDSGPTQLEAAFIFHHVPFIEGPDEEEYLDFHMADCLTR
ncbi:hypothetical protein EDB81DRAFT_931188 [Dactylonectria macrodidyma]|uniref:Uncharacterized protein n=1 Tax=Dactylonectria macrodidyma TaxID=307937 RepID=A0A9P9JD96_9HYPO|nr:hypothetical protein EDB81DRAFT_931188 [Dactylonectria macrodidyma]